MEAPKINHRVIRQVDSIVTDATNHTDVNKKEVVNTEAVAVDPGRKGTTGPGKFDRDWCIY